MKTKRLLKESILSAQLSIKHQDQNNNEKTKEYINKAIEKISKALINEDNSKLKKDIILECYSLFERLRNRSNINSKDKEKDKQNKQILYNDLLTRADRNILDKEIYLIKNISKSIEIGCFFTENLFIRKEIWAQSSAKIPYLNQKYEVFNIIFNRIDGLLTLCNGNVIVLSNFDRFVDTLVDIQNSFSTELNIIKSQKHVISKEIAANSFIKKFNDFSAKLRSSILSTSKIADKPDYIEILNKTLLKSCEIDTIYSTLLKQNDENALMQKVLIIKRFYYQFLFKLIISDLQEITHRFLKKKFLSFENK